jgi:nitrate/TMAO reductase-like tetraheme cytochrome c subunit
MARKHGLELAQNVGCNRILCCSDSLDVIQAMQDGGYSNGAATILDDFYHLATEFSKVHFEHNCHEPNLVAHEIARYARSNDQHVWLDEAPDFIVPLLVKDVKLIMNE